MKKSKQQLINEVNTEANFFGGLLAKMFSGKLTNVMKNIRNSDPELVKDIEDLHKNMEKVAKRLKLTDKPTIAQLNKELGLNLPE